MDINPPRFSTLIILVFGVLLQIISSSYYPQVLLSTSDTFLNQQLSKYGPQIKEIIDKASIPPISYQGTQNGTHISLNLTNITQKSEINFNTNVLHITDTHNFSILSKNINLTLFADIEFKVGLLPKQKGELVIEITQLQTDTYLMFTQPKCQNQGLGFDLQISKLFVHSDSINIKIEKKTIDNLVIQAVKAVLKSRLPGIIENIALTSVNPLISQNTCKDLKQVQEIGKQSYIIIVNTTQLPYFNLSNHHINFLVDLTLQNQRTNSTNTEIADSALPETSEFYNSSDVTAVLSSNLLNTILWIIDDSKIIDMDISVENVTTTDVLSLVLPGLNYWKARPVILDISTSNKFSHLYIKNGRLVTAISLSVKFVVNTTSTKNQTSQECIDHKNCILACDLNLTAFVSLGAKMAKYNTLQGIVDSVSVSEILVIDKHPDMKVDTQNLESIFTSLVSSYTPLINQMIKNGYPLPIDPSLGVKVLMNIYKNHAGIGIQLDEDFY